LLGGIADIWIVNDPIEKADAIVVLGGGLETRPAEAARLYQKGIAPKILVLNVQSNSTDLLGITIPDTELAIFLLLKKEIPESAITVIGHGVANTHDECIAVRHWAEENKPKRLIFPTDPFHTRRVKWFFKKTLRETGTEVRTVAVPVKEYSGTNWWQNEKGVIAFQNEVLKFGYYLVKY
jgi:uncharacterized SAM-binding protein YcdF (DUF218 family)